MSFGIVTGAFLVAAAPASSPVTAYPAAFFANYQPSTALDMLGRLPGFTLDTGAGVRGFGGAAGNVLIDGVRPTSKDDPLDEILKRVPAASVLRIELVRGGAPGIDMQGKTVLANVIRRKDGKTKLVVSASGTHWYDGRLGRGLRLEGAKSVGATDIEGSLLVARFIDDGAGNGARLQTNADGAVRQSFAEQSVGDGAQYRVTGAVETPAWGGKARLTATLSSQPYRSFQDDRSLLVPGPDIVEFYTQDQKTAEIGLRYSRPVGAKASAETVLLQQLGRYRQTDDYKAAGDIEHFGLTKSTGESIARITLKFDPVKAFSLEAGGEGDFNRLDARTTFVINGAPIALPAANVRVTETRGEGFAIATWRARPTLTAEAGLRVEASRITATGDVNTTRVLFFAKPRAVITWSPNDREQVRFRVEREVDQLNFDDFAAGQSQLGNGSVHAGNPNLAPARAWVFESAFEHHFWGSSDVTLTLRHAIETDIIDRAPIFDPSGVFDAPANIGSGRKDEIAISVTLPTDKLGVPRGLIKANATWRWTRVTDPTTGVGRSISGLHPVDAELHFTQGFPKWKATWGVDVYDQTRETYYRFNEIDTDQSKVLVVPFAEYKPHTDLTLRLEVENASGRGFTHARQIYAGPRNSAAIAYTDIRNLHSGRGVYFRLRKSFG